MPNNKPHPKAVINPNGSTHMEIEPMDPHAPAIGGPGQPILRDGAIAPVGPPLISPEPGAAPGFTLEPVPKAVPEDWKRPGFTGITKT